MAVDNSKVLFSSNWDIDQSSSSSFTTVNISANVDTAVFTFPVGKMPVFDIQFKPSSESSWYMPGWNKNAGGTGFMFSAFASGTTVYARSTLAGSVRYLRYLETIQ